MGSHSLQLLSKGKIFISNSGTAYFADGQGQQASLSAPVGIFAHSNGNIYFTDNHNQRVRMINASGYVSTIAGRAFADGQGTAASFYYPFGIIVDKFENIYVSDQYNNLIRMINSTGYVSTIAGDGSLGHVNGQGLSADFNEPTGLAIDSLGNIFVSELLNHVIRKINSSGFVTTYAGNGNPMYADGPTYLASFYEPCGLTIDSLGNLFSADRFNNRIRMINTTGYVTTVAGNGVQAFHDGYAATAEFNNPLGVALDSMGNIIVADTENNRIRKIVMHYTPTTTTKATYTSSIDVLSAYSATISAVTPTMPPLISYSDSDIKTTVTVLQSKTIVS